MAPNPNINRIDGRQHLVEQLLPQLEKPEADPSLWKTIVGSLFEIKDRISESAVVALLRSKLIVTTKAARNVLSNNLARWTISVAQVLSDLAADIRLMDHVTRWSSWDEDILSEALQLVLFLRYRFLNEENTLPLVKECETRAGIPVEIRENAGETYGGLATSLKLSLGETQNELDLLLSLVKAKVGRATVQKFLKEDSSSNRKISTATLRELLIRNKACRLRSQIMARLLKKDKPSIQTQQSLKEGGISEVTTWVKQSFSELEEALLSNSSKQGLEDTGKHAWRSRTIVVVLDTRTGIVLTGGSKFTCHESTLFSEAVTAISRARLGGGDSSFVAIIQCCTRDFNKYIKEVAHRRRREQKPPVFSLSVTTKAEVEDINDAHKGIVNEVKGDNELPTSDGGSVLCWACKVYNFKPEPPCLRCQRFFTTWTMRPMPSTVQEKLEDLQQWLKGVEVQEKEDDDEEEASSGDKEELSLQTAGKIVYCAETVAAAKLHLLRKGKLALV